MPDEAQILFETNNIDNLDEAQKKDTYKYMEKQWINGNIKRRNIKQSKARPERILLEVNRLKGAKNMSEYYKVGNFKSQDTAILIQTKTNENTHMKPKRNDQEK